MKKAVVIVKKFLDSNKEARVDAYAAQAAFYIIMGAIPFLMLAADSASVYAYDQRRPFKCSGGNTPRSFPVLSGRSGKWNLCDQYGAAVRNSHCCFVGQRPYCHGNF